MSDTLIRHDGSLVQNHLSTELAAEPLFDMLEAAFPWSKRDLYTAIADPYVHEFLQEQVIRTCVLTTDMSASLGRPLASCHRLFGLESQTSSLYVTDLYIDDAPGWASDNTFVVGKTTHYEEFGRPCSPQMLGFSEYFFVAPKAELEGFYGIDTSNANSSTIYSVLVSGEQIVAKRQYTNLPTSALQDALLVNWPSIYVMFARKSGRSDLARKLFSLPFMHEFD